MSTNIAILTGRLTQDVALKWFDTQNGQRALANFTLAVDRNYKNQNGEREADFIQCSVSGPQAQRLAEWTGKGSKITVTGAIKTRNYEKDGQRVYVTEIDVDRIDYLDTREQREARQGQQGGYNQGYQAPPQGQFNQGYQQPNQGYQQQPQGQYSQGYQQPPAQQAPAPNFARDPQRQPMAQQGSLMQGNTTNPIDISDDDLPF